MALERSTPVFQIWATNKPIQSRNEYCIIHQEVLCKSVLKLNHVVDVVTKLVNFIWERSLNHIVALSEDQDTEHTDLTYHTAIIWLCMGQVLKRVWNLKNLIQEFYEMKGKEIPEFSYDDWLTDLAFAVDVTSLMNELNCKLKGKGLSAHEMYSLVKAFLRKLQLLSCQVESNTFTHLPILKERTPSAGNHKSYASMLQALPELIAHP
ncbi:general transcription factor II-I repeat domain-containing protein 2A-like [Thunnus thynnus]|uniref:general transcription factor II-I repeat domain-containing protein 2A-like n=1 Tax=Thunnus thynnus TaxID=8237 RepID=UPI00352930DD